MIFKGSSSFRQAGKVDSQMNDQLKAIMEELPEKPPRSRLEPYKEFIEELRRRGRTYKDITNILVEKFSISVTAAGVHDFVRRRQRANSKPRKAFGNTRSVEPAPVVPNNTSAVPATQMFRFNPDEPLRLTKPKV